MAGFYAAVDTVSLALLHLPDFMIASAVFRPAQTQIDFRPDNGTNSVCVLEAKNHFMAANKHGAVAAVFVD